MTLSDSNPTSVTAALRRARAEQHAGPFRTLDRLAAHASELEGVWKKDLSSGDWVVVRTKNSLYTLAVLGDGTYAVAGGWFTTAGADRVGIAGCTWGGQAILIGMAAAPGMFLEFDNGVRTTRIRDVRVIHASAGDRQH